MPFLAPADFVLSSSLVSDDFDFNAQIILNGDYPAPSLLFFGQFLDTLAVFQQHIRACRSFAVSVNG